MISSSARRSRGLIRRLVPSEHSFGILRGLATASDSPSSSSSSSSSSSPSPPPTTPTPPPPTYTIPSIVDANPLGSGTSTSTSTSTTASTDNDNNNKKIPKSAKVWPRLPPVTSLEEFPPDRSQALRKRQATVRTLKIAADRLIEPPTLHLLAFSAWATMGIASLEGILMCQQWPILESWDAMKFVWWYSVEQLIPSIVWDTQDPVLVARSCHLDPDVLLRSLPSPPLYPLDPEVATTMLRIHLLETTRFFVAGFMMIASIVRAAGVSAGAFSKYEERIRLGREPPLHLVESDHNPGIVLRLCGRDSFTSEVSLQTMGIHLFPVFEQPERVQYLVWKHSEQLHRPVYWCVPEQKYGAAYSWDGFPADHFMFCPPLPAVLPNTNNDRDTPPAQYSYSSSSDQKPILILEADATNPSDPLALGNTALDLTLDDASQGFRRIQERFSLAHPGDPKPFRTLRVYLGNSLEVKRTGGGHRYTLRHRVKYAKEIDVLVDSRAAVLERILDWCRRVAGTERKICFQTSSREYFTSLQKILRCYGYELYDPLDLRALWIQQHQTPPTHSRTKGGDQQEDETANASTKEGSVTTATTTTSSDAANRSNSNNQEGPATSLSVPPSLLGILMEDPMLYDLWQERGSSDFFNSWLPSNSTGSSGGSTSSSQPSKHQESSASTNTSESGSRTHRKNAEMLRQVVKLAKLPRLVHMPTTAETVNAVEALITAGEVDATNCCAILERQEGVAALEYILQQKSDLVRGERHSEWIQDKEDEAAEHVDAGANASNNDSTSTSKESESTNTDTAPPSKGGARWAESRRGRAGGGAGLQMICTSTVYDNLFRQVRVWARMGFSSAQIQKEMDLQFHEILEYSHEAQLDHLMKENDDDDDNDSDDGSDGKEKGDAEKEGGDGNGGSEDSSTKTNGDKKKATTETSGEANDPHS